MIFHWLNRGDDRRDIFDDDQDFAAFERVPAATLRQVPLRLLAYCPLHNHWHLRLWPQEDGKLGGFHAAPHHHPCAPVAQRSSQRRARAKLTSHFRGRDFRLTDVSGTVVNKMLA